MKQLANKGITAIGCVLLMVICVACKPAGWAKDEELEQVKPPAGQLPPLPTSYFPPPPTSSSEPPPPASAVPPSAVTITETVPAPAAPAPAPAPAPQAPAQQPPVITIPLPQQLYN